MDTREEVMAKLEKLLAKANGTDNQAEAEVFFAKAAELMTRFGIAQHELKSAEEKAAGPTVQEVHMDGAWASERPSHLYIRNILKKCFNVTILKYKRYKPEVSTRKRVNTYSAIGTPEDCQFAAFAFLSLEHTFNRLWRARLKEFGVDRLPRSQRNGYYHGLMDGFIGAWQAARKAEMASQGAQSYAIVLVDKDKAVAKWCEDNKVRNNSAKRSVDADAYEDGKEDGAKIRVNRPLAGGDNKVQLQ
jgi:hypothetical protein